MPRMTVEPDAGAYRPPRFNVDVDERPELVVVRVSGELDLVTEPALQQALERAGGRKVRIELAELAFMDSTGLRALLSAARELPELELAGPLQPPIQRLLDLTQTRAILPFRDD
jgi:anti-sigma B factor antagonist